MMSHLMKPYRGFLFDADNTLLDYDRAEREALEETLEEAAPLVPRERARAAYRAINNGWLEALRAGDREAARLEGGAIRDLMRKLGVDGDAGAVAARYLARLGSKAYFLPHRRRVVRELSRGASWPWSRTAFQRCSAGRLKLSGSHPALPLCSSPKSWGWRSPTARFFQAALDTIGLAPDELLCVGDNPDSDIAARRRRESMPPGMRPPARAWPRPAALARRS